MGMCVFKQKKLVKKNSYKNPTLTEKLSCNVCLPKVTGDYLYTTYEKFGSCSFCGQCNMTADQKEITLFKIDKIENPCTSTAIDLVPSVSSVSSKSSELIKELRADGHVCISVNNDIVTWCGRSKCNPKPMEIPSVFTDDPNWRNQLITHIPPGISNFDDMNDIVKM